MAQLLVVDIESAAGLRAEASYENAMYYCTCALSAKPQSKHSTSLAEAPDPSWNETYLLFDYEAGDTLEFQLFRVSDGAKSDRLPSTTTVVDVDAAARRDRSKDELVADVVIHDETFSAVAYRRHGDGGYPFSLFMQDVSVTPPALVSLKVLVQLCITTAKQRAALFRMDNMRDRLLALSMLDEQDASRVEPPPVAKRMGSDGSMGSGQSNRAAKSHSPRKARSNVDASADGERRSRHSVMSGLSKDSARCASPSKTRGTSTTPPNRGEQPHQIYEAPDSYQESGHRVRSPLKSRHLSDSVDCEPHFQQTTGTPHIHEAEPGARSHSPTKPSRSPAKPKGDNDPLDRERSQLGNAVPQNGTFRDNLSNKTRHGNGHYFDFDAMDGDESSDMRDPHPAFIKPKKKKPTSIEPAFDFDALDADEEAEEEEVRKEIDRRAALRRFEAEAKARQLRQARHDCDVAGFDGFWSDDPGVLSSCLETATSWTKYGVHALKSEACRMRIPLDGLAMGLQERAELIDRLWAGLAWSHMSKEQLQAECRRRRVHFYATSEEPDLITRLAQDAYGGTALPPTALGPSWQPRGRGDPPPRTPWTGPPAEQGSGLREAARAQRQFEEQQRSSQGTNQRGATKSSSPRRSRDEHSNAPPRAFPSIPRMDAFKQAFPKFNGKLPANDGEGWTFLELQDFFQSNGIVKPKWVQAEEFGLTSDRAGPARRQHLEELLQERLHRQHVDAPYATEFKVLGLETGADIGEVRKAFRKLALIHHPDKQQHGERDASHFREVTAAYEALCRHLEPTHFRRTVSS